MVTRISGDDDYYGVFDPDERQYGIDGAYAYEDEDYEFMEEENSEDELSWGDLALTVLGVMAVFAVLVLWIFLLF